MAKNEPVVEVEELTAREELEEFAAEYHAADIQEKGAKSSKEVLRPALLELMTEVVRDEVPLARRNEIVTDEELERADGDYEKWVARNFPEWTLVGLQAEEGQATITLEETDYLKKFEFQVGGFKFGRTMKMTGGNFRAQEFLAEVALREDIKRPVLGELLATVKSEIVTVYTFDEKAAQKLMAERPETVAIFQEYIDPGKAQVSLLPIRAIKEEE